MKAVKIHDIKIFFFNDELFQEAVSKLANEKYELLEELSNMKILNQKLLEQVDRERYNSMTVKFYVTKDWALIVRDV